MGMSTGFGVYRYNNLTNCNIVGGGGQSLFSGTLYSLACTETPGTASEYNTMVGCASGIVPTSLLAVSVPLTGVDLTTIQSTNFISRFNELIAAYLGIDKQYVSATPPAQVSRRLGDASTTAGSSVVMFNYQINAPNIDPPVMTQLLLNQAGVINNGMDQTYPTLVASNPDARTGVTTPAVASGNVATALQNEGPALTTSMQTYFPNIVIR